MKNLYIFLLSLIGISVFGQKTVPVTGTSIIPNGFFDKVFDKNGNQYKLADLKAGADYTKNGVTSKSTLICSSGMFDLYFETGSGMESTTDATQNARRTVVCQVFNDLTNFINSPLKNAGNTTRVKIWVRNIAQTGAPSNALGSASSLYNIPYITSPAFGGIADSEIWKTIQSGVDSYTNVTYPIYTNSSGAYHGIMAFNFSAAFNWNTNMSVNASNTQLDLYSVVLHEVTHSLGFGTLMNSSGNSVFSSSYNYYSRYDRYLKNNANTQFLITNTGSCSSMYNFIFNPSLTTALLQPSTTCVTQNTTCASAIKFVGTSTVPVYTPNCFEAGSSLSHFEDQCIGSPNGNNTNAYFTMTDANGIGVTKRFLKIEEKNALQDIGYSLNTTYGNNTNVFTSFINYGGIVNSGINIVGINDGISTNGAFSNYTFVGTATTTNPIVISGLLSNDFNAVSFECLQDMTATSVAPTNLSATSGNLSATINFTSSLIGLHLLRYVPVNASGQKGNITYVYVLVNERTNCATTPACNLIFNGNFEQNSGIPDSQGQIYKACGWSAPNDVSPDYFHRNYPNTPQANLFGSHSVPCNRVGFEEDRIPSNNAYIGAGFTTSMIFENIKTKLVSPLQTNTSYTLSFDVSLAEGSSARRIKMQAYLSTISYQIVGNGSIPINNPAVLFTNPTFSNLSNGWERITFIIPARAIAGEQYLYLGLLNDNLGSATTINTVSGCNYNDYNTGAFNSYYYFDNVSILPLNGASFVLPKEICTNSSISNLSVFLTGTPAGGVFTSSGNGIVNNNGIYSFNPSTAGIGTHAITYTFTNSSGCIIPITSNINVVTAGIVPTFNAISPICPNTSAPVLPLTSSNGITGFWSPATVSNTATGSYTFTPNALQCATTTSLTVTVLPANNPSCVTNPCLPNITLTTPETNSSIVYKKVNWIETNSNYTTLANQNVTMKAGDYVVLKAGTHIKSTYFGRIETCTSTSKVGNSLKINEAIVNSNEEVLVFPNPATDRVTISSFNTNLKSIFISTIDGKTFYIKNNIDSNTLEIDSSGYQNGVYIINIETKDGNIVRKKLIKN